MLRTPRRSRILMMTFFIAGAVLLAACTGRSSTVVEEPDLLKGQRFGTAPLAREAAVAAILSSPEVIERVGDEPVVTRDIWTHHAARQTPLLGGAFMETIMREGESFLIEGTEGVVGASYTVERRGEAEYFLTEWRLLEDEEVEQLRQWVIEQEKITASE